MLHPFTAEQTAQEIIRLCRSGLDSVTLRQAVARRLRKAVPFDACCWGTIDPTTLLITSEVSDVYLLKDTYEVERTVSERSVVVTQPGRRGTGDRGEYTAADETVELTGTPARVEDAEKGTSESNRTR